jgi:hypothetical protein
MIALPCFQAPMSQKSSAPLWRASLRAAVRPDRFFRNCRIGVETFAELTEIAIVPDRSCRSALGRTKLQGIRCNRQNRRQYANDLKWPARPPQASPHSSPRAAEPRFTQTHTHLRGRTATSDTNNAALAKVGTLLFATRAPRGLMAKLRQALGRLYDCCWMIPRRGAQFTRIRRVPHSGNLVRPFKGAKSFRRPQAALA